MKRGSVLLTLVGFVGTILLFVRCDSPMGPDLAEAAPQERISEAAEPEIISEYNLQRYVPIPVAGEAPVKRISSRPDVEIAAIWRDKTGTDITGTLTAFVEGEVYQADITLTAKEGYRFDYTMRFTYASGDLAQVRPGEDASPESRRFLSVVYRTPPAPLAGTDGLELSAAGPQDINETILITDYNLQNYVPVPVAGEEPVRTLLDRPDLTIEAAWYIPGDLDPVLFQDTHFTQGAVYLADITVTVKPGYAFDPEKSFAYPGDKVASQPPNTGGESSRFLEGIIYLATQAPDTVSLRDLTEYLPKPVSGQTPTAAITTSQYTGTVFWNLGDGFFLPDTAYTATVPLTALSGFTFAGLDAAFFTHRDGSPSFAVNGSDPSQGVVTLAFAKTPAIEISEYNLQTYVPAPVVGQRPVTAVDRPELTMAVSWSSSGIPLSNPGNYSFDEGVVYNADITVTAKNGCAFRAGAVFAYPAELVEEQTDNGTFPRMVRVRYKKTPEPAQVAEGLRDLSTRLPRPVTGGIPVGKIDTTQYTGTVQWSPGVNGRFSPGTEYTATVSLTAFPGCTFKGLGTASFTHSNGTAEFAINPGNPAAGTVTVVFAQTAAIEISDYTLNQVVPVPASGQGPVSMVNRQDLKMRVSWFVDASPMTLPITEPATYSFAQGTVYKAEITVTPQPGYAFRAGAVFGYNPAGLVTVQTDNEGSPRKISVTYKKTPAPAQVSLLDLTGRLPRPVKDGTPAGSFSTVQYTGTVQWTPGVVNGRFLPDTAYTATVSLTGSGYTFTGLGPGAFTHDSGETNFTANSDSYKGTVTVVFAKTAFIELDDPDLRSYVPDPVVGQRPVTEKDLPGMAITVYWDPPETVFSPGTLYRAEISAAAKPGYGFKGANGTDPYIRTLKVNYPRTPASVFNGESVDLTSVVPKPVNGGTPVTSFSMPRYTGTVKWTPAHSVFNGLQVYTATVSLKAASGYTFGDDNSFIHRTGNTRVVTIQDTTGVVEISFAETDPTVISDYNLANYVPVPAAGQQPVTAVNRPELTMAVSWSPAGGSSFAEGTVYQGSITVTPKAGYVFNAESSFAYPGGTVTSQTDSKGSPRTITVTYKKTEGDTQVPLGSQNIPKNIRPVTGNQMPSSIQNAGYTGTVQWSPAESGGIFSFGKVYTATISLTAANGYTFKGLRSDSFYFEGSGIFPTFTINSGDPTRGTVQIVFPKTSGTSVTEYDLQKYVPIPALGRALQEAAPSSFRVPGLTVSTVWQIYNSDTVLTGISGSRICDIGVKYGAIITLEAAEGYGFTSKFAYGSGLTASQSNNADLNFRGRYSQTVTVEYKPYPLPALQRFGSANDTSLETLRGVLNKKKANNYIAVSLPSGTEKVTGGYTMTLANSPEEVILNGGGRTLNWFWEGFEGGSLITVGEGVTLTLRNITLAGMGRSRQNLYPLVRVEGGTLVLGSGVVIKDNLNVFQSGLWAEQIVNDGGGVGVFSGGTLRIEGGVIKDNFANEGGGVYVRDGKFEMLDGFIENNKAILNGGGIALKDSTFTLTDGTIRKNSSTTGGGVYIYTEKNLGNEPWEVKDGVIVENKADDGGGIFVLNAAPPPAYYWQNNIFRMRGGFIRDNTAKRGGGIYFEGNKFNLSSVDIHHNYAWNGGGIYVRKVRGTFGSGGIYENTAGNNGGGIYVGGAVGQPSEFDISDGTIRDNTAEKDGGGIYHQAGTITMTNGEILQNKANARGGGVYISNSTDLPAVFDMRGSAKMGSNRAPSGSGVSVRPAWPSQDGLPAFRMGGNVQVGLSNKVAYAIEVGKHKYDGLEGLVYITSPLTYPYTWAAELSFYTDDMENVKTGCPLLRAASESLMLSVYKKFLVERYDNVISRSGNYGANGVDSDGYFNK